MALAYGAIDVPWQPPPECPCIWDRVFEGELLGWSAYLNTIDRSCPIHGKGTMWSTTTEDN